MKSFQDYFHIVKFATPETNVRLNSTDNLPKNKEIVWMRCMSWQDVMHLFVADSILIRNGIFVRWYVPYKPFARQDRITDLRHANETQIFNNILANFDGRFIFLDVHSKESEFGICISQHAAIDHYKPFGDNYLVVSPDAGASKKINPFYSGKQILQCSKIRDPQTGKLSGFFVPAIETSQILYNNNNKPNIVLIDDICDGGGTFIGISENLQHLRKKEFKLILYVTHGLFTKGTDELFKYFDKIITTNSVQEHISRDNLEVLDILNEYFVLKNIGE